VSEIFLPTANPLCFLQFDLKLISLIFQVRDVRLIMDRNSRRSKGVGYVPFCMNNKILVHLYSSKVTLSILIPRINFNYILKCTSNAIMMRDDGNTLHSCLINSCSALKVDDINLILF
jgi:HKD family nuclease